MILKYWLITPLVLFILASTTCKKQEPSTLNLGNLFDKRWLHSYEDDSAGVKAFRPETFNFPPSRGRAAFEIKKDSSFIQYAIAPADGWQKNYGKWKLMANNKIHIVFNQKTKGELIWEIKAAKDDILYIIPVNENKQ